MDERSVRRPRGRLHFDLADSRWRLERVAYPCVATEAVGNTLRGGRLYFDLADSRWKLERIEYPSEVCCVYAS